VTQYVCILSRKDAKARHDLTIQQRKALPMSRTTPSEELDLIESVVAAHPRGIGISDIVAEMARRQNAKVNP